MIFDLIASEYGYSFAEIRAMTMREIETALRHISRRRTDQAKFDASLHGVTIDAPEHPSQISSEKREAMDRGLEKIMRRRRVTHG